MIQIKIIKCSQKGYWYKNSIGQIFDVIDDGSDQWCIPINDGLLFISKDDADIFDRRMKLQKIMDRL